MGSDRICGEMLLQCTIVSKVKLTQHYGDNLRHHKSWTYLFLKMWLILSGNFPQIEIRRYVFRDVQIINKFYGVLYIKVTVFLNFVSDGFSNQPNIRETNI